MPNLVQAEFFHVGGEKSDLYEVLQECNKRMRENLELALAGVEYTSNIKTVIRFFDENGSITTCALKISNLKKQKLEAYNQIAHAKGFRRWILGKKIESLIQKCSRLNRTSTKLVIKGLCSAVSNSKEIAIEKLDHTFRLAKRNEFHDILTRAQHAKGMWLFVSESEHLLSNTNKQVAAVM